MMAPVVRHRTVADMTSDSHRFRTKEQLLAEGFEPDCYPPCDWCFIDAYDPADPQPAMGIYIRPRQGHPPHVGEWMSYENPVARRQYLAHEAEWEAICPIHKYMAYLITAPRCGWCGENPGRVCRECDDEYTASIFGDYQPETDDCGCVWHNIYAERQLCWMPADDLRPITGSMQPLPVIAGQQGQGSLL